MVEYHRDVETRFEAGAMTLWSTVFLAALALRLAGIDFGLPFLYHPDEAEIVDRALLVPVHGPDPGWFRYPSLYLYAQSGVYLLVYAAARAAGTVGAYAEFLAGLARDPSSVYLAGRAATATIGAAAVTMTGMAAARWRGVVPGIAAALLLAVLPLHVEHSHFITTDVPLSFFAALLAWHAAGLARRGAGARVSDYAVAGVIVGLAASTKYPGALLGVLVAAVYALCAAPPLRPARLWTDRRLPAAAAASIAAFVACTPGALMSPRAFVRDLAAEASHMRAGHLGFEGAASGWLVHVGHAYDAIGPAFLLAVVAAAIAFYVMRDRFGWAVLVTAASLFAVAGASRVLFARYLMPILPLWCVLAGLALGHAHEWMARRSRRTGVAATAALLAASLALPALGTFHRLRLFLAPDTRSHARAWVDALGASATERVVVLAERNALPAGGVEPAGVIVAPLEYDEATERAVGGPRYVVLTDRMYRRYAAAPEVYPAQARFYARLVATARPIRVFTPFDDEAAGLLELADGERVRVSPVPGGPDWSSLARRRLAGPIVVVYELPGDAAWPAMQ